MKCLIYCTKAKPYCMVGINGNKTYLESGKDSSFSPDHNYIGNEKIVAEFECDKVEEISNYGFARNSEISMKYILENSCLTMVELNKYAPPQKEYKENDYIYALHISNLKVFDKPKKLVGMYSTDKYYYKPIMKAPKSMCNAYDRYGDHYVIISIQPQHTCNILNGKKTIEVRKQIVKGLKELVR